LAVDVICIILAGSMRCELSTTFHEHPLTRNTS
jgi:hypothetical protein